MEENRPSSVPPEEIEGGGEDEKKSRESENIISKTTEGGVEGIEHRVISFPKEDTYKDKISGNEEDGEEEESNRLEVEIYNICKHKPFLGGFRNKETYVESHDAFAQTRPVSKDEKLSSDGEEIKKCSRDTQTVSLRNTSTQTNREIGIQTKRKDLYQDASRDRIYEIPENLNYMPGDEFLDLKLDKIVKIQAMVRGWLARRRANKMREKYNKKKFEEERILKAKLDEEIGRRQDEIRRRMNPRKKKDFNLLYKELEDWKFEKMKGVLKMPLGQERQVKLTENLRKETKLLQTIDRLKIRARKENQEFRTNTRLMKLSQPKKMKVEIEDHLNLEDEDNHNLLKQADRKKGEHKVRIENPLTVRALELNDLYQGLKATKLSIDERLDVLLQIKWTVKEFECGLTADIVDLIDREADLLNRGRKGKSLVGLRKRLCNLFLQFVETPNFNPSVKKLGEFDTTVQYKNTLQITEKEKKKRDRRKRRLY